MSGRLTPSGSKYSDEQRREAIGAFIVIGNYKKAAAHIGIPERTVNEWSKREWWIKEIAKVRAEKSDELDAQVSNSIELARKSIDERLTVGDPYITKDGKIAFKPVSCRDSTVTFGILYDKRALMRNMPTKIVANQDLTKLMHTFEALVNGPKVIEGETLEG